MKSFLFASGSSNLVLVAKMYVEFAVMLRMTYTSENENIEADAVHLKIAYQYVSNHEVYLLNRSL